MKGLLFKLGLCLTGSLLFTLGRYAATGGSMGNRWPYALFVGVLPLIATALVVYLIKKGESWRLVGGVYTASFVVISVGVVVVRALSAR